MERELIGLCKADLLSLRAKLQQYIGQLYSDAHPANLNQYIQQALSEMSSETPTSQVTTCVSASSAVAETNDILTEEQPMSSGQGPTPPSLNAYVETENDQACTSAPPTTRFALSPTLAISQPATTLCSPSSIACVSAIKTEAEEVTHDDPTTQQSGSHVECSSPLLSSILDEAPHLQPSPGYLGGIEQSSPSCSKRSSKPSHRRPANKPKRSKNVPLIEKVKDPAAQALARSASVTETDGCILMHCPVPDCPHISKSWTGYANGKNIIAQHIRRVHTGSTRSVKCPHCAYSTLKGMWALRRHFAAVHKMP